MIPILVGDKWKNLFLITVSVSLTATKRPTFMSHRVLFIRLIWPFVPPSILPVLNFAVGSDLHNSDHFPLLISHVASVTAATRPRKYLFQRADWKKFTLLAAISEDMVKVANIDDAVRGITEAIIWAADTAIPKSSPNPHKLRKPWWNDANRDDARRQRKLWDIFRRYPTTENLIAFKAAKAYARRVRRQSQRESFIRFVSFITSSTSSSQIWRRVKAANGLYKDFTIPILKSDSATYSCPEDIANIIGQTFAYISNSDFYTATFQAIKNRAEGIPISFVSERQASYNCDFRMSEMRKALSQCRNTSPGSDGVTYSMLHHLNEDSLSNLLRLFNRICNEHIYPSQWREALVIPILKPGKDATDPMNYRPIALTSCLSKTLERMINVRLVYELETQNLIPMHQSDFRKGRSTLDNAIYLETQIRNAFVRKAHLVSFFLT
ncbi:putative RNA-directed DNA polymerase from transposon X-element [Araneus ventricosus]|uniref:Putative RNA-directed DNA polymerase from transposon X-element n=1 Tax=Araneus ventricosus TaxID=182803 RepID=A0A4Y2RPR1_ARAVE|nr:putative RNA-directed DNA polymerase from transposon X-element [Araneus ventricosus]